VKARLTTLDQCRIILRAASWIVPLRARTEWRKEWDAELSCAWQISQAEARSAKRTGLRRRCCGAFLDAAWYRFNREDLRRRSEHWSRTPAVFLLALISALLLFLGGSGYLPRMRSILMPPPYADAQQIVTVSRTGVIDSAEWVVPYSWVKIWRRQGQVLEGVAAYDWRPKQSVLATGGRRVSVASVQVEDGLLGVFGVKLLLGRTSPPDKPEGCRNCLVLSYQAWRRNFSGDPNILQKRATIDGQQAIILGVLPERFWFPSDDVGVLRLADEGSFSADKPVGVVARLRPRITERWAEWQLARSISNRSGEPFSGSFVQVWRVQDRVRQPLTSYGLTLCLSLVVMAVVVGSGRLNLLPQRWGAGAACRWWAFFATKTSLFLLILLAGVVEFTPEPYVFPRGKTTLILESVSLWIFSIGCVFLLWWSLIDQQRRCRVCLQRLALPAYIGRSGCLLLSWAGTELVCAAGHGLLHVTETDVCWLNPAQWTQLDESWKPLFAEKLESEVLG
jgi:hypothetical protein